MKLFVSCAPHLESLLLQEISGLGITGAVPVYRGVSVPYSWENIFTLNYLSRLSTRVLLPLSEFFCPDVPTLYHTAKKIDWSAYLSTKATFAIDATISHPHIRNSLYGAQILKDAICDQIRDKRGNRPSVDVKTPDVQLHLFIHNKQATISFDTSGIPLYKRGWKEAHTDATLPETLAAALLMWAGYSSQEIFCDPFCGSGTLLIEAACMATHTPAGYFRNTWGFFHLPHFSYEHWKTFRNHWDAKRIPLQENTIWGIDCDAKAIALCRMALKKTGFEQGVVLLKESIGKCRLPRSPTLVVTDPPFGKRMQSSYTLYQELGGFLRSQCPAMPFAYLLALTHASVKAIGGQILSERPLHHGGMPLHFYQIHVGAARI